MNYFELFGIPVTLQVNEAEIKKIFYRLSRQYHPDFYAQALPEVQAEVLEKSSLVNRAYNTFRDPDLTIRYVLQLKGLLEEEEKYQLNPEFLMEVMDVNEALMEMDKADASARQQIKDKAGTMITEEYEKVAPIVSNYQDGITKDAELLKVKDYYFRKKYMDRLLEQVI